MAILVYRPADGEATVSQMLDDVRGLIVDARQNGERPTGIVVTPKLYREVMEAKARETARGTRIVLFGMEIFAPDIA